ncbi:hypothetical protein JAAN108728_09105 [Janibacter anophelis]
MKRVATATPLPTAWGYVLVRESTDEPWAIIGKGV